MGLTSAQAAPPHRRGWAWLGALTAVLLTLGLAAQVAWWGRGDWLRHPRVHAVLTEICPTLGCEVPLPYLPGTIEIIESALTADPIRSEALRLRLGLVSHAEVAQRLPVLQLELYDPAGTLLAVRRFDPAQYLADKTVVLAAGLPPRQGVQATLDIALPGTQAGTQAGIKPTGFRVRLL